MTRVSRKKARKMSGLIQDSNTNDTTRKVLSDITNSERYHTSRKRKVADVQFEEINIAEEGFLHDHTKCMKAQRRQEWTIDDLFEGFGVSNGFLKDLPSVKRTDSPPRSPFRLLKEAMLEDPILDRLPYQSPRQSPYQSPPQSPPNDCQLEWYGDIYDFNFKLNDSLLLTPPLRRLPLSGEDEYED